MTDGAYELVAQDAEPNGLANVLVALIGQNLQAFPERQAIASRMPRPVAVRSTDTDQSATVVFQADHALVYNSTVGDPVVTVEATVSQVLDVSQLRMKAGGLLPVGFFTKRGMRVLGQILTHRLVVKGLLTHPITSLRFIALVSVAR